MRPDRFARLAAFAAAPLLLAACQQPAPPATAGTAAPAPAPATSAAPPAPAEAKATPPAAKPAGLSSIVALSTIGVTKDFLERTLGKSTYETPDQAQYKADGCDVSVDFDKSKAVKLVSIDLKPGCSFDAAGLTGSDKPVPVNGPMTFAQFERTFGPARYLSPCLRGCGNAYDPYVDAVIPGTHANGVVDISGHSTFVAGPVLDASNVWEDRLVAQLGEEYVDRTKFNCEREHDDIARAAFAGAPVESLQFGRDLGSTDCL